MHTYFAMLWHADRAALQEHYEARRLALLLTKRELWSFYKAYVDLRRTRGSSLASLDNLLVFLDVDRGPLVERMYNVLRDGDEGISFASFLLHTWCMCATDTVTLTRLAFNLADLYGYGCLGLLEVRNLIDEVYGTTGVEGKILAAGALRRLCAVDVRGCAVSARLRYDDFAAHAAVGKVLLFPAFLLQQRLALRVSHHGLSWERNTRRRAAAAADGRLSTQHIADLFNAHVASDFHVVAVSRLHLASVVDTIDAAAHVPVGLRSEGKAAVRNRGALWLRHRNGAKNMASHAPRLVQQVRIAGDAYGRDTADGLADVSIASELDEQWHAEMPTPTLWLPEIDVITVLKGPSRSTTVASSSTSSLSKRAMCTVTRFRVPLTSSLLVNMRRFAGIYSKKLFLVTKRLGAISVKNSHNLAVESRTALCAIERQNTQDPVSSRAASRRIAPTRPPTEFIAESDCIAPQHCLQMLSHDDMNTAGAEAGASLRRVLRRGPSGASSVVGVAARVQRGGDHFRLQSSGRILIGVPATSSSG